MEPVGPAERLGPPAHLPEEVEAQRAEQREVRGEVQALVAVLLGEGAGQDVEALAVPLVRHLAAVALLVEDHHLPEAVHDLGVVVHREDAGHDAPAVAGELEHRDRVAGRAADPERLVADGDGPGGPVRPRDEVEQAVLDHAEPCGRPGAPAKRRNQGCSPAGQASTFSRMPVLLPFSGPRSTGSAAPDQRHSMPKVWQTARSAASSLGADRVEEAEGRLLPGGVLADALGEGRDPVVRARVDVARPAGARRRARSARPGPPAGRPSGARRRRGPAPGARRPRAPRSARSSRPGSRGRASRGRGWASRGSCRGRPRRSRAGRRPGRPRGAPPGRTRRCRRGRSPGSR